MEFPKIESSQYKAYFPLSKNSNTKQLRMSKNIILVIKRTVNKIRKCIQRTFTRKQQHSEQQKVTVEFVRVPSAMVKPKVPVTQRVQEYESKEQQNVIVQRPEKRVTRNIQELVNKISVLKGINCQKPTKRVSPKIAQFVKMIEKKHNVFDYALDDFFSWASVPMMRLDEFFAWASVPMLCLDEFFEWAAIPMLHLDDFFELAAVQPLRLDVQVVNQVILQLSINNNNFLIKAIKIVSQTFATKKMEVVQPKKSLKQCCSVEALQEDQPIKTQFSRSYPELPKA
jgi:hypothetical protein